MAHNNNKYKHHETAPEHNEAAEVVDKARLFWDKYGKMLSMILGAALLLVIGFWLYKDYVKKPKEQEALDKSYKAEELFRLDSFNAALNGDGINPGFVKIADKYSGTAAGNLAKFYAGVCYVKLNQNDKAVKYLKDFNTDSKQVQQRAYKLLGDAYGDMGKGAESLEYYKKSAHHFEADEAASADALFSAAYLAQNVLKKNDEAINLYKELKEKYPRTQQGFMADQYLAQLGVYNVK